MMSRNRGQQGFSILHSAQLRGLQVVRRHAATALPLQKAKGIILTRSCITVTPVLYYYNIIHKELYMLELHV